MSDKVYARVEDGLVMEIVTPGPDLDGNQYPLVECFPESFVEQCVEITGIDPMPDSHWTYNGQVFAPPVPYLPTPEEILEVNTSSRNYLLAQAA